MKNIDQWSPTKFIQRNGRLIGSRNQSQVQLSSRLVADRLATAFQQLIPRHVHGDLLDHGCGQAPLYGTYHRHATTVTCVDWPGSPHDIQHADVMCDVNGKLPIDDESFDIIVCSDVLEHLHSPDIAVSEMTRVLRPGGKILLSVPFMYGLHEQPFDFHRYTRHAITKWCDNNELVVDQLDELGGAGDVVCNIVTNLFSSIPVLGSAVAIAMQWTWFTLRRIPIVKRMDLRTARQFPLEYVAVLIKPIDNEGT